MYRYTLKIYLATLSAVLLSGCTTVYTIPQEPYTDYPDEKKIPLNIGLVKTHSLLAAKWDDGMRLGEFGTALLINTEAMADKLFDSSVTVENIKMDSGLDGYLIPEMKFVDSTYGMAFQDIVTTLILEWEFTDPKGKTIWFETVEGQGTTKAGVGFGPGNYKQKFTERARIALDDLFNKSYKAISTSSEIQKYTMESTKNPVD